MILIVQWSPSPLRTSIKDQGLHLLPDQISSLGPRYLHFSESSYDYDGNNDQDKT